MAQFLTFLLEGGNAVEVASRINQRNVASTLEDIYKKVLPEFKIKKSDTDKYVLLGSAGKKADPDSSGDLDIAISIEHVKKAFKCKTEEDAVKKISEIITSLASSIYKEYGHEGHLSVKDFFKLMPGLMTFSVGFPITNTDGKQEGLFVQLDIMPSDNVDLVGWAMSSPGYKESSTKGAVRNILLSTMIKYCEMKVVKKDDNGEPAVWKRYYLNPKSGLYYATQERKLGKSGKYTKESSITDKKLITGNKDKIVQFLFGPKHKASDFITFEQLWAAFNSDDFKYQSKREEIKKEFINTLKRQKYDVPKLN